MKLKRLLLEVQRWLLQQHEMQTMGPVNNILFERKKETKNHSIITLKIENFYQLRIRQRNEQA